MPINSRYAPDCTAKAITHRVQKFRDASSQLNLGSGPSQPATPGTGKKRGRKPADPEGANVEEAEGTPTKKRGRKPANTKGEKVEAAVATPTKKRQPSKVTDVEEDDDAEEGEKTGAKVEVSVKSEAVEEDEG